MIHFLVHDKKDTVGVAVIEGIKAGQELIGWVMEDDSTIKVKALNDIPIGHKVATQRDQAGRHRHQVRLRHRQGGRRHQGRRARARAQHQDQALVKRAVGPRVVSLQSRVSRIKTLLTRS